MHSFPINQFQVRAAGVSQALFGANHGYRFAGDTVHLNAMFSVIHPDAHRCAWALQLWACPVAPTTRAELSGQLVAHAALPPIGEIADEVHSFEVTALASQPAGQNEHVMVLALVAGDGFTFDEVHDLQVYARRERFLPPRLSGAVSYRIDGERVEIFAERIENPRSADNRSGTLAIELWALPAPYRGGAFHGAALAGAAFDPLAGQMAYHPRSFYLPFTTPPAGTWSLVLMLREWTPTGYATRDFVNFDQPYVQSFVEAPGPVLAAPEPVVIEPATSPSKAAIPAKPRPAKAAKPAAAIPAKRPSTKGSPKGEATATKVAPVAKEAVSAVKETPAAQETPAARGTSEAKEALEVEAAPGIKAAPVKATPKAVAVTKAAPEKTSVNEATLQELTAVKGVSEKLAQLIVAKRPFTSLADLASIKGLNAKLLERIQPSFKL